MTLTPQTAKELVEAAKEFFAAYDAFAEADTYKRGLMLKACHQSLRTALSQAEREMEGGA